LTRINVTEAVEAYKASVSPEVKAQTQVAEQEETILPEEILHVTRPPTKEEVEAIATETSELGSPLTSWNPFWDFLLRTSAKTVAPSQVKIKEIWIKDEENWINTSLSPEDYYISRQLQLENALANQTFEEGNANALIDMFDLFKKSGTGGAGGSTGTESEENGFGDLFGMMGKMMPYMVIVIVIIIIIAVIKR